MNKKEIIIPLLIIGITVLFVGICLAVFLTNGKSKKWIARKMKIGGILLTITAASCNSGNEEVMCYQSVASNSMWMHANSGNGIEIMPDTNNVLFGSIYGIYGSEFSFAIIDKDQNKIQSGTLIPLNGEFKQQDENFKIELDKNLKSGSYFLNLFATGVAGQDTIHPQNHINLVIKDE